MPHTSTMLTTESVPWRVNIIPMADLDIDEFVLWREQQRQRNVIETRKPMPQTPCMYFWTRRMTGTDIISMITTTKPIGAGQLKEDIGPQWAEAKKPEKFLKKNVVNSKTPFDSASGISAEAITEKEKARINRGLWKEHREFMEKLHRKRQLRARVEGYAVTRIQALFRGWTVRQHWSALHAQLVLRRDIRADLRELLSSNNLVLQGVEFRQKKMERRRRAAISIQAAYRRMLSYRALDRKRVIWQTERRRGAATRIQCLVRRWRSLMLTAKLREHLQQERRTNAATRLQAIFRGSLGRKKHRIVARLLQRQAAVMIQCAWRMKRARVRVRTKRATSQDNSREFGSRSIQRIVRGFLSRQRCRKLNAERRERRRAWATFKLQTTLRKWHSQRRVAIRRARMRQSRRLWAILHVQRIVRGFVGRKRAYNKRLLFSIDIWTQIRLGDDLAVEEIYKGVDTDQPLTPDHKDDQGNTLLIMAARWGQLRLVRKCLQWKIKVNAMNAKGQTALHVAIAHRHAAVAEYLLLKPDAMIAKSGRTLLHESAKGGLHMCALNLLNYGVDVDAVDPGTGRTALHEACKHGHPAMLRIMLKESRKSVDVQDRDGKTPLHWAAVRGSLECAQQLVQAGAGVKTVDKQGRPALVYAILSGFDSLVLELEAIWSPSKDDIHVELWTMADQVSALKLAERGLVVSLGRLLDLGLPVDGDPKQPETVLLRAAKHGKKDVVVLALQKGASAAKLTDKNETFLHLLLQHPSSELGALPWSLLLPRLSLLSATDKDGRSPLHYVGAYGHALEPSVVRTAKGALVKGVELNLRDKILGSTPLHLAAANASAAGLKTLLALGADVTVCDIKQKRNALHVLAASTAAAPPSDVRDCLAALLATTISLTARDCTSATATVLSSRFGNTTVLETLLPRATPKERNESVFWAARAGRLCSLEILNPDAGMRDDSAAGGGLTLLGYAIKESRYEALSWLLGKGADPAIVCEASTGRTGLHLAAAYGTLRTVDMIMAKIKSLEDKDSLGYTPLVCAILSHNDAVTDMLLKKGALARPALQAGTWGWVLAAVQRQERKAASSSSSSSGAAPAGGAKKA